MSHAAEAALAHARSQAGRAAKAARRVQQELARASNPARVVDQRTVATVTDAGHAADELCALLEAHGRVHLVVLVDDPDHSPCDGAQIKEHH